MNDVFLYLCHRKGYPNPISKFLIILPLWLGFLGALGVMIYGLIQDEPAAGYFFLFALLAILLQAVGIGLSYLVLKLLPKRRFRLSGSNRSKIPFAGFGYAIRHWVGSRLCSYCYAMG